MTYIRVLLAQQRRRLEIVEAGNEVAATEIDLDYTFPGCRYRGGRSTLLLLPEEPNGPNSD